jgi:hypothetical protein
MSKKRPVVLPGDSHPELLKMVHHSDGHIRELWGNPMTLQAEWFVTAWTRETAERPAPFIPGKGQRPRAMTQPDSNMPKIRQYKMPGSAGDLAVIACLIAGGSLLVCAIGSFIGNLLGW